MGLFDRNRNEVNFAGGSKNVMESIQRGHDVNALIYLDAREDFNTNSVITVAPNEQVIFIKNGEFYGTLLPGRHEIKSENIPLFSRIRNMLSGGMSTFTCQVYHVNTSEQNVGWGTSSAIEVNDEYLGLRAYVRGAGEFRVRFNIREDDDASKQMFMRLMGDKSIYTSNDLSMLFKAQISTEVCSVVAKRLEEHSKNRLINAVSSQLKDFSIELKPIFDELFLNYGLELVNFSFYNLTIDETEERKEMIKRLAVARHSLYTEGYDKAVQQELLKDIATNPHAGGIASAGAGFGMGMAAGNVFAQMATTAFGQPQQSQVPQQPIGFGGQGRFGVNSGQQQPVHQSSQSDPMETLAKMKKMLEAGLISQQQYDKKVEEVMSRM